VAASLTPAGIRRLAALARLDLTDADVDRFAGQIATILEFVSAIQAIDTTGVEPATDAGAPPPAWRDDRPAPSLDRDAVLDAAPDADRAAGLFRVPRSL